MSVYRYQKCTMTGPCSAVTSCAQMAPGVSVCARNICHSTATTVQPASGTTSRGSRWRSSTEMSAVFRLVMSR